MDTSTYTTPTALIGQVEAILCIIGAKTYMTQDLAEWDYESCLTFISAMLAVRDRIQACIGAAERLAEAIKDDTR